MNTAINRQLFTEREKAIAAAHRGMKRYLLVIGLVILTTGSHYLAMRIGGYLETRPVTIYQSRIVAPPNNDLNVRNESCLELMRACYARKRLEKVKPLQ